TATIAGGNTGLIGPFAVALDGAGNIYAVNGISINAARASITVYAAAASGNATPTATIAGDNTGLGDPHAIAPDAASNISVTNATLSSTLADAAVATATATPGATIAGGNTGLGPPFGIALDGAGNIYVTNPNVPSITVYAAGASG